jgi:hypothetical protein
MSGFDYAGWAAWGRWRRRETEVDDTKRAWNREVKFVLNTHNCFVHCDYPSECHRVRHKATTQGRSGSIRAQDALSGTLDSHSGRPGETHNLAEGGEHEGGC